MKILHLNFACCKLKPILCAFGLHFPAHAYNHVANKKMNK